MSDDQPRVVFDCNIFFQAFLTPRGPAFACVKAILDHRALLLLSRDVLSEARDVLVRPFVRERFPLVTEHKVEEFLGALTYVAEVWRAVPHVLTYERDPDDEPYLNLAAAGRADLLVTRDNDLLSLPAAHSPDAQRFRQVTPNRLRIIPPTEFLRQIESAPEGDR
jgi:putative PIN family toxin of toxin-antitoxin system